MVAAPDGVTLGAWAVADTTRASHCPEIACPGTPQTNSYVPALDASNVKVCSGPLGRPAEKLGVVAPENAGLDGGATCVWAPDASTARLCVTVSVFSKCTTTCQPTGTVIVIPPRWYPLNANPPLAVLFAMIVTSAVCDAACRSGVPRAIAPAATSARRTNAHRSARTALATSCGCFKNHLDQI